MAGLVTNKLVKNTSLSGRLISLDFKLHFPKTVKLKYEFGLWNTCFFLWWNIVPGMVFIIKIIISENNNTSLTFICKCMV